MITDYIPKGHKNAISRTQLSIRAGLCDRKCRSQIEQARQDGEIILNTGEGYFIYSGRDDDTYLNEYITKESHRFSSIGRTLRKLKKAKAKIIDGQMTLEDMGLL